LPITRSAARELTTREEQQLVDASFHPAIRALSEARVRQKIGRARRLRDKYADLSRRQTRDSKRKGRGGGDDNKRTGQKARLFAESLERFEKRLAVLTAPEPEVATAPAGDESAKGAAKGTAKRGGGAAKGRGAAAKADKTPPARADKLASAHRKAIQSHLRSAGRRNQTKRDGRRK
jgi:hypothetical protein